MGRTARWIHNTMDNAGQPGNQQINFGRAESVHPRLERTKEHYSVSNRGDAILKCEKEEGAKYSNSHLSHALYGRGHEFIMREAKSEAARVEYGQTE